MIYKRKEKEIDKNIILGKIDLIIDFLKKNNGEKSTYTFGGFEDGDEQEFNIIDFALEVKDYIEKVDEEALFRYNLNKIDDIEKDLPF